MIGNERLSQRRVSASRASAWECVRALNLFTVMDGDCRLCGVGDQGNSAQLAESDLRVE